MTDKPPHTPPRQIRIPDGEWLPFEEAAQSQGQPRAAVVREFIRWYMRRPGAKLPERPAVGPWTRSSNACNAPNYTDRCELPAGHDGRHKDGNMSWPQGVERPVSPVGSEEETG